MCRKVGTKIYSIYIVPSLVIPLMWRVESIWSVVELDLGLVFAFIIFNTYKLPNSLVTLLLCAQWDPEWREPHPQFPGIPTYLCCKGYLSSCSCSSPRGRLMCYLMLEGFLVLPGPAAVSGRTNEPGHKTQSFTVKFSFSLPCLY